MARPGIGIFVDKADGKKLETGVKYGYKHRT